MMCGNGKTLVENLMSAEDCVEPYIGRRLNRRVFNTIHRALDRAGHDMAVICVYRIDTPYFLVDGVYIGTGTTADPDGRLAEIDVSRRVHRADYDPRGGSDTALFVLVTRDDRDSSFADDAAAA